MNGIEMHHHVARQFAWCRTGVPAPNAGEGATAGAPRSPVRGVMTGRNRR